MDNSEDLRKACVEQEICVTFLYTFFFFENTWVL
jgi:hypothetical protein